MIEHLRARLRNDPKLLKAAGWQMLSAFLYAFSYIFVGKIGESLPTLEVLFARQMSLCLFVFLAFTVPFVRVRPYNVFASAQSCGQIARIVFAGLGMGLSFTAYAHLPVGEVHAIGFLDGIVATALAIFVLKEKLDRRRGAAIAVVFFGVALVLFSLITKYQLNKYIAIALLSTVFEGLAQVMIRKLGSTDGTLTIMVWQGIGIGFLIGLVIQLYPIIPIWPLEPRLWITPNQDQWWWLALMGASAACAQACNIKTLKLADVSFVTPLRYTRLFWAPLLGWLFISQPIAAAAGLGMFIIAVAGAYSTFYDPGPLRSSDKKSQQSSFDFRPCYWAGYCILFVLTMNFVIWLGRESGFW